MTQTIHSQFKRATSFFILLTASACLIAGTAMADQQAAYSGTYGLRVSISDTSPTYVADVLALPLTTYRAKLMFNTTDLVLPENGELDIVVAYDTQEVTLIGLSISQENNEKKLAIRILGDPALAIHGGSLSDMVISDGWHSMEFFWSSTPGNGEFRLWIDGNKWFQQLDLSNSSAEITAIRVGALAGLDVGTSGTIDFDEFASQQNCWIGTDTCNATCMLANEQGSWPNSNLRDLVWFLNNICL